MCQRTFLFLSKMFVFDFLSIEGLREKTVINDKNNKNKNLITISSCYNVSKRSDYANRAGEKYHCQCCDVG